MKDKKKIIICVAVAVIVAASIIVGVFIGKRNADKNADVENSTTSTTTTMEENTTTTEIPTSEKTDKDISVTIVDGIISNTDRNNFEDVLGNILWFNFDAKEPPHSAEGYTAKEYELYNFKPYDYKSVEAKRYAYNRLLTGYHTLLEEMGDIYNWWDFNIYECWKGSEDDPEFEQDPKKLLGEFYCYVEEKYVDIALKTVFNVQPDHNYVLKSKDGEVYAYYLDGYYYYRGDEGGDGAGPDIDINNIMVQSNGKFLIDATYYVSSPDGREKIFDLKVMAEMKTVEGKSLWSFYKIEKA